MAQQIRKPPQAYFPGKKTVKDKDYLGFIAKLPCIVSKQRPVQVAHLSFANAAFAHYGRGKGTKANDRWTLPLSVALHAEQHQGNEREFWLRHKVNPHLACVILYGIFNEGGDDAVSQATAIIMAGEFGW